MMWQQWLAFALGSVALIGISWRVLRRPQSHGFYRFFAWEVMLALLVLNAPVWFEDRFALHQKLSWLLLFTSLLVLGLYAVWMVGALWTAAITPDPFGRLVIVGLTGFVAAQTFINVGMNVGLLPIVGITLPYLSYGGSSMVMAWLCTGLILSIAMRRPRPGLMRSFEWDE